jgi:hypothetical protein
MTLAAENASHCESPEQLGLVFEAWEPNGFEVEVQLVRGAAT